MKSFKKNLYHSTSWRNWMNLAIQNHPRLKKKKVKVVRRKRKFQSFQKRRLLPKRGEQFKQSFIQDFLNDFIYLIDNDLKIYKLKGLLFKLYFNCLNFVFLFKIIIEFLFGRTVRKRHNSAEIITVQEKAGE